MNIRRIFVFFSLVLTASLCAQTITMENSHAKFRFDPARNYQLTEILNKKTGRSVRFGDPGRGKPGLWSAELLLKSETTAALYATQNAKPRLKRDGDKQELTLVWENVWHENQRLQVTAKIVLPDDSGIADWSISAEVTGKEYAAWIKKLNFPLLQGIQTLGDDYYVVGEHIGRMVRNPVKRLPETFVQSPTPWSMQFAAFYGSAKLAANPLAPMDKGFEVNGFQRGTAPDETGLLISPDDATGYSKTLHSYRNEKDGFTVELENFPRYPHWPMEKKGLDKTFAFAVPYTVKLGTYTGGNAEAARIYRSWAMEKPWMARGPVRAESKRAAEFGSVSPKMLDCAFWGKFYFGADKVVPELAGYRQYLQVPMNTHWVAYYETEFDNNNLEYFPVRPRYLEGARDVRSMGMGAKVYVCCGVWDMDTDSFAKYDLLNTAAALNETGMPYIWELFGQPNAWMNPAAKIWRDKFHETSWKMFRDWGVDGEYLDVLAAADAKLCYNDKIGEVHGSDGWTKYSLAILKNLREQIRKYNPESFMTSECFAENYISYLDGFLTLDMTRYGWLYGGGLDVYPMFSQIYHDYAIPFGSDCNQLLKPDAFRWQMGHSFVWGIQPTYSQIPNVKEPETASPENDRYTREIAHAWHRSGSKFLTGGLGIECAQVPDAALMGNAPAAVISQPYAVTAELYMQRNLKWQGPAVPASAWRAFDGTIGFTLANITDKSQDITLKLEPAKLNLADGKDTLWRTWPLPAAKLGKVQPESKFTLPAATAMILELRDDSAPVIKDLETYGWKFVKTGADGKIAPVTSDSGEFFGAEDAMIINNAENGKNVLTVAMRRGSTSAEGLKPFFVLKPTGVAFAGAYKATVWYTGEALISNIELKSNAAITYPDGLKISLVNSKSGQALTPAKGTEIPAGTYRLAAYRPVDIDNAKALEILRNPNASEVEINKALARLTIANADAFSAAGFIFDSYTERLWVLPEGKQTITFSKDSRLKNGKLEIMRPELLPFVTVTAQQPGAAFEIAVKADVPLEMMGRMVYSGELNSHPIFAVSHINVDYPLIAELIPGKKAISMGPGETSRTEIGIRNTSPYELEVTITADLPEGWTAKADSVRVPGKSKKIVPVDVTAAADSRVAVHPVKIYTNFAQAKSLRHFAELEVSIVKGDLEPARLVEKPLEKLPVLPWLRYNGRLAVAVEAAGEIELSVKTMAIGSDKTASFSWSLTGSDGKTLDSGKTPGGMADNTVKIPVSAPGIYFINYSGEFFKVEVKNQRYYAYSAGSLNPYVTFFWGERIPGSGIFYFHVPEGAAGFEIGGHDGGPLEPARIVIRDASGKAVFDRDGRWSPGKWYKVQVPKDQSGKIWSMEILPVQDLKVMMRGEVTPFISPDPAAVLKFK